MIIGSVYCCLVPLLAIVLHFSVGETLSSGFTLGMVTGIAAVVLFFVIQYAHALKSEKKYENYILQKRMNEISIFKTDAPVPAS